MLNAIEPFKILVESHFLYLIPSDLFIDFDGDKLTYSTSIVSWSHSTGFNSEIFKNLNQKNNNFLFANSKHSNICNVFITAHIHLIKQQSILLISKFTIVLQKIEQSDKDYINFSAKNDFQFLKLIHLEFD